MTAFDPKRTFLLSVCQVKLATRTGSALLLGALK
jgi:hypothetical protein